jgi:hypothetical protein
MWSTMLGEELWLRRSMGVYGECGVLLSLEELMGWGYGRILGKAGTLSKALRDWRWGKGRGLVFGMICGVVIRLSSLLSHVYLVLLVRKMPQWRIIMRCWGVLINGMLVFLERLMIGR